LFLDVEDLTRANVPGFLFAADANAVAQEFRADHYSS
jgi:hypothetical protein